MFIPGVDNQQVTESSAKGANRGGWSFASLEYARKSRSNAPRSVRERAVCRNLVSHLRFAGAGNLGLGNDPHACLGRTFKSHRSPFNPFFPPLIPFYHWLETVQLIFSFLPTKGRILTLHPKPDGVWSAGLRSGAFLEGSRLKPVANRRSGGSVRMRP